MLVKSNFKEGSILTAERMVKNNFKQGILIAEMLVEKQFQGGSILTAEAFYAGKHSNCWNAGKSNFKGEAFQLQKCW